jgi:hypothetical protein
MFIPKFTESSALCVGDTTRQDTSRVIGHGASEIRFSTDAMLPRGPVFGEGEPSSDVAVLICEPDRVREDGHDFAACCRFRPFLVRTPFYLPEA